MPAHWRDPQELAQLDERYGGAHGARRELERLRSRIDEGEWVTDAAVLTLRDRVTADVRQRERDYSEREGYCNTTAASPRMPGPPTSPSCAPRFANTDAT